MESLVSKPAELEPPFHLCKIKTLMMSEGVWFFSVLFTSLDWTSA